MDYYLLTLWNSVSSGNIKKEEIAEVLHLSPKQTTRYIQKWSTQGWLTFTPGKGRGNVSKLQWIKDVEEIFEEQLLKMIEDEPVETSSKYLLFDWSKDSKLRLMNKFRSKLGYFQSANEIDKLIIPRRYPLLTMHPLKAAEVHSANMVANVFNRLVAVDERGLIYPELAHSWDECPTSLRLYIKKDVKFHDGSILVAEDVVECLEKLRRDVHFQDLWEPVKEIKVVAPLILDIYFPKGCNYCLQMLGTLNASIYKESKDQVFGTGAFYAENNHDLKTTLFAFKDYFQERPLLDEVEFVQVPKDFDIVYRSSTQEVGKDTVEVESDSGFGVVIMNTFRKSDIQRKEVRDYIHHIISKHRHNITRVHPRAFPNNKSCLIGQNQGYTVPKVKYPDFTGTLIMKLVNYTEQTTHWLKEIFDAEGVPVEIKWVSFEDTVTNSEENQQVDLFIHGEVFEMNQDFSFYQFLKNGYSPLAKIIKTDHILTNYLNEYAHTPFHEWTALNLKVEKVLLESSIMIPLYYEKRQIPFSVDLMNISIKHFGYVDFSKLWVRPQLE
ncbi:ABC transporter substrate-binding protein [Paenisporosarcina indica]|uniref:ABC transporter substrate-binding protein n=1 Tax=Paenisporosarcina indica TaxID=650093 RepID=UPI000950292C|nr:ABC transporter substrate-binding protein [Paenisporosarcina indica]